MNNYIVENLLKQADWQDEFFLRHELQTGSTFSNFESILKTISDRVDALTQLVEGLVSTPVVNVRPTVFSVFG